MVVSECDLPTDVGFDNVVASFGLVVDCADVDVVKCFVDVVIVVKVVDLVEEVVEVVKVVVLVVVVFAQ